MLKVEAPFPQAGSNGFLFGSAQSVRIIQRNADGTCVVQRTGHMSRAEGASRTLRVAGKDIVASQAEASPKPTRRRKAA